jgi:hypothetical protein
MSLTSATGGPLSCGTFVGPLSPVRVFEKTPIASRRFRLQATPVFRVIAPSSTATAVIADRTVSRLTGPLSISDYNVSPVYLVPLDVFSDTITITSSDVGKILSPANNLAQAVGTGNVVLKGTTASGDFAAVSVAVTTIIGQTSDIFISYAASSAAKHASDAVDTRIANKGEAAKPIYSTQNHSAAIYVRNPQCWAADLDLTCISPWNSTGGNTRAGTLISPRHVLFASHFRPAVGATIRFVTADNATVTRTITAIVTHSSQDFYTDIDIGVLDADVPSTISFAKVMPQNWPTYFPSIAASAATIPAIVLDQEEKALVADWSSNGQWASFVFPTNAQRQVFSERIIAGDSGNPSFVIINNQLVVLTTWTTPNAGTNLVPHKNAINTIMANLGGGYQLTEVDMSAFSAY